MDHRLFSKELAEALIESENRDIDEAELASNAYQNLCHDDPLPITPGGCYALQKAIINPKSPYALSRRLVDGIDQCVRHTVGSKAIPSVESVSSSFVETVESKHEAYALLAWTVHAYIPLKCIKAKTLPDATFMLGSLLDRSGVRYDINHENQETISAQGASQEQLPTPQPPENGDMAIHGAETNGHHHDSNELEEIFAEESDGSDFEFESGFDADQQVSAITAWSNTVKAAWNPERLSRAPSTTDWKCVAVVVSELLQNCRFNCFSELSLTQWRNHRISEQLTQLVLALLVPQQSNRSPVYESPEFLEEHWRRRGVNVLHIFRDAFHQNEAILEDYLSLIRILVQIDRASTDGEISIATLAGLGALSSLCGEILDRRKNVELLSRLKSSILDACDDLSAVLEKSGSNGTLEWTFLPFFEVLTSDLSTTGETAQLLLNSGMFRQWLLRWSEQESQACKAAVHVSLLNLCLFSSGLLGKYAWRFNGLAATSTALPGAINDDTGQPVINAFCWNLLGMHLSSSATSTVKWTPKNPSTIPSNVAPTQEGCKARSLELYHKMCSTAVRIIQDWKVRRENKIFNSTVKLRRTVLEDLVVLSHRLKHKLLRKLLLEDLTDCSTEMLKTALLPLQILLIKWPKASRKERNNNMEKEEQPDETQNLYRTMVEEDTIVTGLRKAVKTILTTFDRAVDDENYQTSVSSFSSKAD